MQVQLAGFNIDLEIMQEIFNGLEAIRAICTGQSRSRHASLGEVQAIAENLLSLKAITPETIVAAYARISRDPRAANELRREARLELEKARNSNRTIVFSMGHNSIAEHAVFNFDILGISRLLVESVESHRLISFTEKSQRYLRVDKDFIIPNEVKNSEGYDAFISTVVCQCRAYEIVYQRLVEHFRKLEPATTAADETASVFNRAKEDARYLLSLCQSSQLGMTVNARNLELLIRRLRVNPLAEAAELAHQIYAQSHEVAPSLIRYTEPTPQEKMMDGELLEFFSGSEPDRARPDSAANGSVRLLSISPQPAALIARALHLRILGSESSWPLDSNSRHQEVWEKQLFYHVFKYLRSYEAVLKEFELVEFIFELTVSASCFAQLKRHRMMTLIPGPYEFDLGYTIPPSIIDAKLLPQFEAVMERVRATHERLLHVSPHAAAYIVTNAHRRKVICKTNLREFYHFCRLREDAHAQWDIRGIASQMNAMVREQLPLLSLLLCGKDKFAEVRDSIFGASTD